MAILVVLCIRTYREISMYSGTYEFLSELWPVMSGAREYIVTQDSSFKLPSYWFLFHEYLFFLIGFYPVNELNLGNGQALIRSHSKKIWYLSKLFSAVVNVILYYLCFVLFLAVGNLLHGGRWMPENHIIGLAGILIDGKSLSDLFLAFLLLPLLVSTALVSVQLMLSFLLGPVSSFMIITGYLIASVFWMNPLFIGNYSMLLRQSWVSGKQTITVPGGIVITLTVLLFSLLAGMIVFDRKDVLPTEQ